MYCRYKCCYCGDWHPLGDTPTRELQGMLVEFIMDPPPPFDSYTWNLIIRAEFQRRRRYGIG